MEEMLVTEAGVTSVMLVPLGRRAFDQRSVATLAKTALACVAVLAAHHFMAKLGPARIVADGLIYAGLVVGMKAVRIQEAMDVVRLAVRQKGSYAGAN